MGVVNLSATFSNAGGMPLVLGGVNHQPIAATELAAIRTAVAALFDTPCVIYRKTRAPDGYLGSTETWAPIAALMVGMAQPTAGQLQNYAYLIGSLATWQIRLPYGTDVKEQDHLLIAGETLVVQVQLNPRSFASTTLILASEVK